MTSYKEFTQGLANNGFEVIGMGVFGEAWAKPNAEEVVKVSRERKAHGAYHDGWPIWAAYCHKHPSPVVPSYGKVHRYLWMDGAEERQFSFATVPRCLSLDKEPLIRDKFGKERLGQIMNSKGLAEMALRDPDQARRAYRTMGQLPHMKELIDYIDDASTFLREVGASVSKSYDNKDANWLVSPTGMLWPNDVLVAASNEGFDKWWPILTAE